MSDFSLKSYVTDHKTIHLVVIGGVSISGVALAAVLGILLNKVLPESIEKD